MPYNQNIPLATDKLSSSQVDINNNFTALQTLIDVDHVDFSNTTNQGMHAKVTFPIGTAPAVSTAGYIGLYGATSAGKPQIWVNNVAPGLQIPMTESNLATPGYTYLPSGIILQWGGPTTINNGTPVTFNKAFSTCFSVQLTAVLVPNHETLVYVSGVGPTGFTGYGQTLQGGYEAITVYYLAIGK